MEKEEKISILGLQKFQLSQKNINILPVHTQATLNIKLHSMSLSNSNNESKDPSITLNLNADPLIMNIFDGPGSESPMKR
jgi:hypothetical protein